MTGLELRVDVLLLHQIRDNCWRAEMSQAKQLVEAKFRVQECFTNRL